jgi:hypothetical protein
MFRWAPPAAATTRTSNGTGDTLAFMGDTAATIGAFRQVLGLAFLR